MSEDWFEQFTLAAQEVTGLDCFAVWAAPFDVLFALVATKARVIRRASGKRDEPERVDPRHAHYPPGVRKMFAMLEGRS